MKTESDGARLARIGTDGALWSAEMAMAARRIAGGSASDMDDLLNDGSPGGWLHVWLCNAIEAGRAAGAAQEARTGRYASGMAAALGSGWREG